MGDWRTLHFFDEKRYKKEIIPLIRNTDNYLPTFLNESRLRWLDGFSEPREKIIKDTIDFIAELNTDLNIHPRLIEIQERRKDEVYDNYIRRSQEEYRTFILSRKISIEIYEFLLIETIFSTVADFNPHFLLGKRLFESCIGTKKNSIAKELISEITFSKLGTILDLVDGGIINWLTQEEVELLLYDMDNVISLDVEGAEYVNEFKEFVKLAVENKCGLISLRNPREKDLSNLQLSLNPNEHFVTQAQFKHIIIDR